MENENGVKITITDDGTIDGDTNFHADGDPIKVVSALEAATAYYIKNLSCDSPNEDAIEALRLRLALHCVESIAKFMLEEDETSEGTAI